MKIVVTGADGQLGSEFKHISKDFPEYSFEFTNRDSLDITAEESVEKYFRNSKPDILINCAAYTNVDKAEQDNLMAKLINEDAVSTLAKHCQETDCILIHYSSDYVYHNKSVDPLREDDSTTPKGIYAKTKLAGETQLMVSCPKSIIIRTSWVYSSFGNNFVKTMLRLGRQRDELTIVNDQIGTPTYARDIAEATMNLIPKIKDTDFKDFGVYNYSNLGITNWMDFAKKIFELENIKCDVYPTTTEKYGAPADRPLWSVLSKEKFKRVFDLNIPTWEDSLSKCLDELK